MELSYQLELEIEIDDIITDIEYIINNIIAMLSYRYNLGSIVE